MGNEWEVKYSAEIGIKGLDTTKCLISSGYSVLSMTYIRGVLV